MFEPFYTSSGMGSVSADGCRTIVAAHGGALWAANNPDRGATFHIAARVRTPPSFPVIVAAEGAAKLLRCDGSRRRSAGCWLRS